MLGCIYDPFVDSRKFNYVHLCLPSARMKEQVAITTRQRKLVNTLTGFLFAISYTFGEISLIILISLKITLVLKKQNAYLVL